jgi:hypothetical protein
MRGCKKNGIIIIACKYKKSIVNPMIAPSLFFRYLAFILIREVRVVKNYLKAR